MAVVMVTVADSDIAPYQSCSLCNRLLQLRVAASRILTLPFPPASAVALPTWREVRNTNEGLNRASPALPRRNPAEYEWDGRPQLSLCRREAARAEWRCGQAIPESEVLPAVSASIPQLVRDGKVKLAGISLLVLLVSDSREWEKNALSPRGVSGW